MKCKNYQMENVAFTYHMTVQKLKEKEIEMQQKMEDTQGLNRRMETTLRLKNEEAYQFTRERD